MYLSRRIYVGAKWEQRKIKGTINLTRGEDNKPIPINVNKVDAIIEEVMYWRKANQIHRFFVENVQDGVDDCKEYYVRIDVLKRLVEYCKHDIDYIESLGFSEDDEVFPNLEEDKLKLPTQGGFFFGSTDYDHWYLQDLKQTVNVLEPLLEQDDLEGEYYYQSSW